MPSKLIKTIAKWLLNLAGVPEEKKSRVSAAKKRKPAKKPAKKKAAKKKTAKPVKKKPVPKLKKTPPAPKPKAVKAPPAAAAKKALKPVVSSKPVKEKAPGLFVGTITHYFPKAGAAVLKVEKTEIKTGAKILIQGDKTNVKMVAASIQINRIPVPSGKLGEDIGIGVKKEVAPGDKVYLI